MAEENTDTVIVTGRGGFEKTVEKITDDESEPSPREKYKSAILQLISDIQANAPYLAFVSFCIGCANVPIHFMLLAGATCKVQYCTYSVQTDYIVLCTALCWHPSKSTKS